jgi:actin-like ATPase involved in cell morphogenesis
MKNYDIGIDLGTTFSVISVAGEVELTEEYGNEAIYLENFKVSIIPTPENNPTFPSVIVKDPDNPKEYIVGSPAKDAAEKGKEPVMFSKRYIGTTEKLKLEDETLTAKQAAVIILKYLKHCAERALGGSISRAVITHPAFFDRSQIEETREAAIEAGFDMGDPDQLVQQVMMEPAAAAMAYVKQDDKDPLKIMVYDLGGGTFDVTILERKAGVIGLKAFEGNNTLGGYNFDKALANWIIEKCKGKNRIIVYNENDPVSRGQYTRLLHYAEEVKEQLAHQGHKKKIKKEISCNFLTDDKGNTIQFKEKISQEDFVALIKDDLDYTIERCRECLKKASMKISDLDYILLVGGSTHGPWITELIEEAFGVTPLMHDPDISVAAGAAIQASQLPVVTEGEIKFVLNSKSKSVLRRIDISGSITDTGKYKLDDLTVMLRTSDQTLSHPPLEQKPDIIFQDVLLDECNPTEFKLEINNKDGINLLTHDFSVAYNPEIDEGGVIQCKVLPKPLFLRTLKGMVPLLDEGEELPNDVQSKHVIKKASNVISIDVFQGKEKAGEIVISDVPVEAVEDTIILLGLTITERCEIRGKAQLLKPSWDRYGKKQDLKLVAKDHPDLISEHEISVKFPPVTIPTIDELRQRFQKAEIERENEISSTDNAVKKTKLTGAGGKSARNIKKKLDDIKPDRQGILQDIITHENLIHEEEDEMQPPWSDFASLLLECRQIITETDKPSVKKYESVVDSVEKEGKTAYDTKNEKKWIQVNNSLESTLNKLKAIAGGGGGGNGDKLPPTYKLKEYFMMEVSKTRGDLEQAVETNIEIIGLAKYETGWKNYSEEIHDDLNKMDDSIEKVPDDMDNKQALARLQQITGKLKKLEKKIKIVREALETE